MFEGQGWVVVLVGLYYLQVCGEELVVQDCALLLRGVDQGVVLIL